MAPTSPEKRFSGMVVYFVETGMQPRRMQIWKQKLQQLGAEIEDRISRKVTHIFAANSKALAGKIGPERLKKLKRDVLSYQWLEDCLKEGSKLSVENYRLQISFEDAPRSESVTNSSEPNDANLVHDHCSGRTKRTKNFSNHSDVVSSENQNEGQSIALIGKNAMKRGNTSANDLIAQEYTNTESGDHKEQLNDGTDLHSDKSISKTLVSGTNNSTDTLDELSMLYNPPNLNRNITEPFENLRSIYKALGDDRRSFSYNKAISVLEKIPFKIVNVDQVKGLPAIGKSLQEHIRTISLFGEVWGIGPTTASKLYERGHRTLEDLKKDDSLTTTQKIGLKFFDDINKKIPRHEVEDMEALLQKAAECILPGVLVVCGGSYRRGKAFCSDMDIVITHPDGTSHKGFLQKFVKYLKGINFLKEDLMFSIHSIEGTDSGVDTYFGLCTYPGREQRHRIDLKVYPSEIFSFGLIAWTGNDVLNRRLRLLADKKGYKLDDTGLYPVTQSAGKKVAKASSSVRCETEREVFDYLGFPWLEPNERNL
ncbi:DNA polymerase lambda isoform X2 [Cryptomeria japonica]|uniref:DNA polymerase lambda isoform X2 n=1 Tax=Cryptomeria japonica TaxID=3369 RepID=UPI0025AD4E81|nr:DNA polymerase lambda isoform X2 [Cryptomeria japonica]